MSEFFAADFHGVPFQLFGPLHWSALAFVAFFGAAIIVLGRRGGPRTRRALRYSMAALLWGNEILWHWWHWRSGLWYLETMLPFHLCTVMVWLGGWMLIRKDRRVYPFVYLLGAGGALQTLATPDLGAYSFPHYRFFAMFLSHGLIVISALYMTLVEGFRPQWQDVRRVILWGNVYAVFVFFINLQVGSNYLFINRKLTTPSLLDLLPPWPWYLPYVEALAVLNVLLFYAPFARQDRFRRAQALDAENA